MRTLQDCIDAAGNPATKLQKARTGAYVFPIPAQFTNRGPGVVRFLSHVGVNSFAGFGRNKAKQLVFVSPDGRVIGDGREGLRGPALVPATARVATAPSCVILELSQ